MERTMRNKHHTTPDFVKKDMSASAKTDAQPSEQASSTSSDPMANEALEETLNDITAKIEDYKSQTMRLHAEMDNLRKRSQKDIEKAHKYALDRFAADRLPVIDSLEHGLSVEIGDNEFAKNVHDGLKMTLD